jgi:hypothetical protein
MVLGLNPGKGKTFFSSPKYPERFWNLLGFFPGGNAAGL